MSAPPPRPGLIRAVAARSKGRLALLGLMLLSRMGLSLAAPALLAAALHDLTVDPGASTLDRWGGPVLWLGLSVVALGGTELIMGLVSVSMTSGATVWLQTSAVAHLLRLGDRSSLAPGEATARVGQGASTANLPYTLLGVGVSLLGSLGALGALWWLDWRVGLTFTLALPVVVVIARRFVRGMTSAQSDYLSIQSGIAGALFGALSGARSIRASGTVEAEIDRVLRPLPALHAAGRVLWLRQRRVVWQLGLLVPLTQVLALAVAGLGVSGGRVRPTDLVAVWGYLALASGALGQIDALAEVAYVRAGTARLAELLAVPAPAGGSAVLPAGPGTVSWRGVRAGRPGDDPVLAGFDLDLPAGVATAFVGRSGVGKSLAAALIGRLVDPYAGRVLLDGVPVDELPLGVLRAAVVYAFDRPVLVGATVREAIGYGRTVSHDEVVAAARAARADGFIRRLPDGYDTPMASAPLSGGERQRLGLARALIRPARVYVLDDATSGLDTVTEAEVSRAVTSLLAGRTRVVVAHRAATAAACAQVVWLHGGRVRATGRHAELWRDPDYRAVFDGGPTAVDTMDTPPMVGAFHG